MESKLLTMARGSTWSGPCQLLQSITITLLLLNYTDLIFLPWICGAHSCVGSFALAFPFVWKSLSQSIGELCSLVKSPTQRALPGYPCIMPFHCRPISFYSHLGCVSSTGIILIVCFSASMSSHGKYSVHMGQLKRGEKKDHLQRFRQVKGNKQVMVVLLSYGNNNRKPLTLQSLNGAGSGTSYLSLKRVAIVYRRGHLAGLWPSRQDVRGKKHSDLTFLLPSRLLLVRKLKGKTTNGFNP